LSAWLIFLGVEGFFSIALKNLGLTAGVFFRGLRKREYNRVLKAQRITAKTAIRG
jgi:hypothetical protein